MVLVGPSLGAAVAIDFAANHPEAVIVLSHSVYLLGSFFATDSKLILE